MRNGIRDSWRWIQSSYARFFWKTEKKTIRAALCTSRRSAEVRKSPTSGLKLTWKTFVRKFKRDTDRTLTWSDLTFTPVCLLKSYYIFLPEKFLRVSIIYFRSPFYKKGSLEKSVKVFTKTRPYGILKKTNAFAPSRSERLCKRRHPLNVNPK